MNHEIRTLLNAIIGFSTFLVETDNDEDRRCYVDIINQLLKDTMTKYLTSL